MTERTRKTTYVFHPTEPVDSENMQRSFCVDCVENGVPFYNFGRCYECADGYCERCLGVPCQCECPGPFDAVARERRIRELEAELADLKGRG